MNLIKFCTTYSVDPIEFRRRCFYSPMGTNNIVNLISNGEVKNISFNQVKDLNPKEVENILKMAEEKGMTVNKSLKKPDNLSGYIDILLPCGTFIKNVDCHNSFWNVVVAYS